ncbi:hypothetical protein [Gynuella sunshinyii]|uniref:Uncharacterized protein n=1 Tax=Gynuella sunshinyii YC6258 TaxID=1445510 RepID=A0A0C5VEH8_9GAMM|nr:hypothetical protein [Gynuella sunshinyii]AJQ92962.1 hypothetical Protein YC6258_00912 [Gynuella sunshinyii YC6258]
MKQMPEVLTFFCRFDAGLAMLRKGSIPLETETLNQNPFLQNHPFDDPQQTVSEEHYRQELYRQYTQLPELLRGAVSFDYFCQQSEAKRSDIESALKRKSVADNPPKKYPEQWKKLATLSLFEPLEHFGLWQYRGNHHLGLALQLNCQSPAFASKPSEPAMLKPVIYEQDRHITASADTPFPGCLSLPPEIQSEQEWRLLKPLQFQTKGLTLTRNTLTRVVFGARCPETAIAELRKSLALDMRYKSLRYARMVLHPDKLKLRVQILGD